MADPIAALKEEMSMMKADNIEHIISKDQVFQRMQQLSTECETLKLKHLKAKHRGEQQDKSNQEAYIDMTKLRD
jgi:hypothetical protein